MPDEFDIYSFSIKCSLARSDIRVATDSRCNLSDILQVWSRFFVGVSERCTERAWQCFEHAAYVSVLMEERSNTVTLFAPLLHSLGGTPVF